MRSILIYLWAIAFYSGIAQPQAPTRYYPYFLGSTMALGHGYHPQKAQVAYPSAFEFEYDTIDGMGSGLTTLDFSLATTKTELKKALDLDVSVEMSFLTTKANASLHYSEKSRYESNRVYIVLKGETEYGRIAIKKLKLSKTAKDIYDDNTNDFHKSFGFEVPTLMRHGSRVYIVVELENISTEFSNSLRAELSAKYSGVTFSGEFKSSLKKELKQSSDESRQNITVINYGGSGFAGLDGVIASIKEGKDVDEIKANFGKYLNSHTFRNSAPIGYFTLTYRELGLLDLPSVTLTAANADVLRSIVAEYRESELYLDQVESQLAPSSPARNLLADTTIGRIETKVIPAVQARQKVLAALHEKCLSGNCKTEGNPLNYQKLLPKDFNIEVRYFVNQNDNTKLDSIWIKRSFVDYVGFRSEYYTLAGMKATRQGAPSDRDITGGAVLLEKPGRRINLTANIALNPEWIILNYKLFDTGAFNTYIRFPDNALNNGKNYMDLSLLIRNTFGIVKVLNIGRFYPKQDVAQRATALLYVKNQN